MCEAKVYLLHGDENLLVMEAVDRIEPVEEGVRLENIFGEQKFVQAEIQSLSLVENRVVLKAKKSE